MTIKELRTRASLSQTQFAKRFFIPLSTLRKWEQGARRPPDYVIALIAKDLALDPQ